jgi:NAD(P)-dependent dehydrogenase (short-subunit alcohol dehydrogenase family)
MTSALVTGAARGIGRAVALALARRGIDLLLLSRTRPEQTERLVVECGVRVETFAVDLCEAEATIGVCRRILGTHGAPDIVIHNAGTIDRQPVELTTLSAWDRQLGVNLRAPYLITRELLPALRARGHGRIIHVASISATLGTARAAAYCASKWGLLGFMKSLAEELKDSGLMTVAVLPGSVDTQMLEGSGFEPRMTPDEVAKTIAHYALDAPLAHNGAVIEMFGV